MFLAKALNRRTDAKKSKDKENMGSLREREGREGKQKIAEKEMFLAEAQRSLRRARER